MTHTHTHTHRNMCVNVVMAAWAQVSLRA